MEGKWVKYSPQISVHSVIISTYPLPGASLHGDLINQRAVQYTHTRICICIISIIYMHNKFNTDACWTCKCQEYMLLHTLYPNSGLLEIPIWPTDRSSESSHLSPRVFIIMASSLPRQRDHFRRGPQIKPNWTPIFYTMSAVADHKVWINPLNYVQLSI